MLKAITGKTIAQLDADFRDYLDVRLAPYKGTFQLPTTRLRRRHQARDRGGRRAQGRAGEGATSRSATTTRGDADKAGAAAQQALALDAKQPIARYVLAEIAVHAGRREAGQDSSTGR